MVQHGDDTEGTAPRIGADGRDVMRGESVEGRGATAVDREEIA